MTNVRDEDLLRYLEDELVTSDAKELERAIESSPELGAQVAENQSLLDALRTPDPEAAQIDLVADVRRRVETPRAAPRRWWWAAVAVALLMAVPIALWDRPSGEEFRAKSLGVEGPAKWTGVRAFVVGSDALSVPLADTLRAEQSVVFTYTNRAKEPFSHLMIFGVDAKGGVNWYYPAYTDASTNPAAVTIRPGTVDVPLPDRIGHALPSGRYLLHAVFMHEARSVRAVEKDLASNRSLESGGAFVQRIETKVP